MTTASEQNTGRGRRRGRGQPDQQPPPPPPNAPVALTNPTPEMKPVAKKRRPAMMALALMLVALSALGGVWLVNMGSQTVQVLRVTTTIQRGQPITAGDLAVVEFPADVVGFETVAASELDAIASGQVAQYQLNADTLLAPNAYGPRLAIEAGRAQVVVSLSPDLVPATALASGDPVMLVETPATTALEIEQVLGNWPGILISQDTVPASGEVRLTIEVSAEDALDVTVRNRMDRIAVYFPGGVDSAAPTSPATDPGTTESEPTDTQPAEPTDAPAEG